MPEVGEYYFGVNIGYCIVLKVDSNTIRYRRFIKDSVLEFTTTHSIFSNGYPTKIPSVVIELL